MSSDLTRRTEQLFTSATPTVELAQPSVHEAVTGDIFHGPVGVIDGLARERSGAIEVRQDSRGYNIQGTRFPLAQTPRLETVVLTSGKAVVDIDDGVSASPLTIHRKSGYTDIFCGDKTAIIISGHSGHNECDGFVANGEYTSPQGEKYTVVVPEDKAGDQDTSWVNRLIRVDQVSGYVNISRKSRELGNRTVSAITKAGLVALDARSKRVLEA
jgi:hypothetical protein